MSYRSRAATSTLVAALALALSVASASAQIIEFQPTTMPSIRATVTFTSGSTLATCPVTLSGSLIQPQITMRAGETLGRVTRVEATRCTPEGTLRVLSLPWTVTYQGFSGVLLAGVTSLQVRVNGFAGLLELFGGAISCLYTGTPEVIAAMASGSDPYRMEAVELRGTLTRFTGSTVFCPERPTMAGRGFWSALWAVLFGESTLMRSQPAWITKALAPGNVPIPTTALSNVNVTAVGLEKGTRGWVVTPPVEGCVRMYVPGEIKDTCTVNVNGAASNGLDSYQFFEGARVVGKIVLAE